MRADAEQMLARACRFLHADPAPLLAELYMVQVLVCEHIGALPEDWLAFFHTCSFEDVRR
jgi:hypothetical protein